MWENSEIQTERLALRKVVKEDTDAVYLYAGDKSIDMMLFFPLKSRKEAAEFVSMAVFEWEKESPYLREWMILHEGEVIGGIDLEKYEEGPFYEIGWLIRKDKRGQGFATEAARALLSYAFDALGAEMVQAHCDSRNLGSEKVMQKIGMSKVGEEESRTYPKTGEVAGEYSYRITREQFIRQSVYQ